MATVSLRGVRKSYGPVEIIKGVDLDIKDREFCVFGSAPVRGDRAGVREP